MRKDCLYKIWLLTLKYFDSRTISYISVNKMQIGKFIPIWDLWFGIEISFICISYIYMRLKLLKILLLKFEYNICHLHTTFSLLHHNPWRNSREIKTYKLNYVYFSENSWWFKKSSNETIPQTLHALMVHHFIFKDNARTHILMTWKLFCAAIYYKKKKKLYWENKRKNIQHPIWNLTIQITSRVEK